MSLQIGGGLGDEYMRAPPLSVGGSGEKGHGGFIANILDALGIHRQVAKGPKEDKKPKAEKGSVEGASQGKQISATGGAPAYTPGLNDPTSPMAAPPVAGITILDDAQAAFSPLTPRASKFGLGFSTLPSVLR